MCSDWPRQHVSGWWFQPEKYESQLGLFFSNIWKNKHVPNHQPDFGIDFRNDLFQVFLAWLGGSRMFLDCEDTLLPHLKSFGDCIEESLLFLCWLVVYLPLWKIWKSVEIIIPNMWKVIKKKSCSKPPTSLLAWLSWIYAGYAPSYLLRPCRLTCHPLSYHHPLPAQHLSLRHPILDRGKPTHKKKIFGQNPKLWFYTILYDFIWFYMILCDSTSQTCIFLKYTHFMGSMMGSQRTLQPLQILRPFRKAP